MHSRIFFIALSLIFLFQQGVFGQDELPIKLTNPGFEDMPRHSKPPRGWYDCGSPYETPPDVQPSGAFSVNKPAMEGETYLGMVVRDNDSQEAVAQRLAQPIQADKCYEFSLSLSRSELYVSLSRTTEEDVNYTTPAKLRIWGGNKYCDKKELLAESSSINHRRWLEYNFRFEPKQKHTYIMLEAFYVTPTLFPYNGNVLVDGASDIVPVPCEEPEELAIEEPEPEEVDPKDPPQNINVSPSQPKVERPVIVETAPKPPVVTPSKPKPIPVPEKEATLAGVKRKDLRAGQTIQIDRLYFQADQSKITEQSYRALDDVYKFLNKNKDIVIEVGGHTNSTPPDYYCDSLSTQRAKSVVDYLTEKGIDESRLQYKGYGKRNPVASNKTPAGRRRNQRVEVKVLSFNG